MSRLGFLTSMVLAVFLVAGLVGASFGTEFQIKQNAMTSQGPAMLPDEVLVKFKPGVSGAEIAGINARHGATEIATSPYSGVKRLKIPPRKTVAEMVTIYSRNPNVAYAEPNYLAQALWAPNDPYYSPYQWHFENSAYGGINMEEAWAVTTGLPEVVVAVIDTGVAFEDYQEYVALNKRRGTWVTYLQAPDLANTVFVPGYDFVNNDDHPNDDEGHGTHVTGTIAQSTNNGVGVAGIAFNTAIMPIKVLDSSGSGTYTAIADGIYFAANHGARVISMSLGGSSSSITLETALAYAYNHGVTIVCASGNNGSATTISYPAAYDAYCIAVGATRFDETVAGYSNRGASLDLTAPGGDTGVDQNGDGYPDGVLQQTFGSSPTDFGYYFYQGTSMATPHVSGVAALLLAQDPTRTPATVREILQATAEDKGPSGWDPAYGWGIVDAAAALHYAAAPNTPPVAALDAPALGTEDIAVPFSGVGSSDADGDSLTYRWNFGDGSNAAEMAPEHAYAAGGRYLVTLVVNDGKVDSAPAKAEVLINEVNDLPVADAGPDQAAEVGLAVAFDAAGSYDIDDGIASYAWDFGDGSSVTSDTGTTSHTYAAAGTYPVTLMVTDYAGAKDTDQALVTVTTAPIDTSLSATIDLVFTERRAGKNLFVAALATVGISAANGPVDGVTVVGHWNDGITVSAVTDTAGQVVFVSPELKNPASGTDYTFTVTQPVDETATRLY